MNIIAVYLVGKDEKELNAIIEVAVSGECLSHEFQTYDLCTTLPSSFVFTKGQQNQLKNVLFKIN